MLRREWPAWLVAPLLLVVVAVVQWWRVAEYDQSSWSGVGFGMFATFGEQGNRRVRVDVTVDGTTLPALAVADIAAELDHLRTVPSAAATRHAAARLAELRWSRHRQGFVPDPAGGKASRVVVTVLGVAVRHRGGVPTLVDVVVRRSGAS